MSEKSASVYLQPKTIKEAWQQLAGLEDEGRIAWVSPRPADLDQIGSKTWLDLSKLEIGGVEEKQDFIEVGCGLTINGIREVESVSQLYGGLIAKAARKTAHHGLRNLATLGALILEPGASPELSSALLATGARLVYFNGKEHELELAEFWSEPAGPALPLHLRFDKSAGSGSSGAIEWVSRSPMDLAFVVAAAAIEVEGGKVTRLRLAAAGDGFEPQRLVSLEQEYLETTSAHWDRGGFESKARQSINPKESYRASPSYQQHLVAVLSWRAMNKAVEEVEGS